MATIVRQEYRKPYVLSEGGYQEMMATPADRSIWNKYLEEDPQWSEFQFIRGESQKIDAATRRRLKYLAQSELKKPYLEPDYEEMEYKWPGPIPGIWPPFWQLHERFLAPELVDLTCQVMEAV